MKYSYLITLILFTGLLSCSGNESKNEEKEETVETILPEMINEVTVFTLASTDFNHELISNGKLTSRQHAELRFESAEPIAAIYVKNGDRVSKGQKLAELSPFKLANQVAQTRTALAQSKLEMQDLLIGQGYMLADSAKVPQATLDLVKIQSGYEQSVIAHELAKYEEQQAVLVAPFDGVVANLFDKPFNTASTSEPFCTIIDTRSMEANFTVLESELPLIKIQDKVIISPFAAPDQKTEGRISEINPYVDENGMVQIKATVVNNGRLFEGMNVRVSIQRSVGKQLVIPKSAVVLRSGKQVVFTLVNNKAYWNYVQTGLENSGQYTITEGLKEGDIIITSGNINLAHEAPVEIIDN